MSSPLLSSTRAAVLLFHVHILFLLLFFITKAVPPAQCHRIFFPHLECSCRCCRRLCNGPHVITTMLQLQRRFGGQDDGGGEGDAVVKKKPLLNLSPPPAQVLLHHHHHTCHYCDNQPRLPPPPPPKTPENHRLPPSPVATAAVATITTTTTSSSILDDRLDCGHCDGDDAVQYSSQPPLRRRSNHRLAHLDVSDCRRRSCCSSSCTAAPDRSVDVVSGCKPQSTRTTLTVQSAKAAEAQTSSTSTTQIQTATTSYYRVHQLTQTSSSHLNNCLGLCDVIMLSKRKRRKGEEEIATGGICLSRTSPTPTPSSSSVLSPLKPPPSRVSSLPLSLFSSLLSSSSSTSTSSSSSQLTTTYLCRRFLLFLFCLFTVISASSTSSAFAYSSSSSSHINGGSYHNFDQLQQTGGGEFPPYYSQYYPPYLVEDVRVQPAPPPSSNRQGKSRPLAKAPSVPAARLYLDPATFTGGEVTGHAVLRRRNPGGSTPQTFDMSDSDQLQQPDYLITGDIFVPPGARLEIEPGVRIAFAPRVGLTVRGSLLANVSNRLLAC